MEKIYYELTGIDIEEQKRIWDERGKGYYGEYLVLQTLYVNIPGRCKILMNLEIPAPYGKSTEIDLLMIHETGLYVFEIKHHKGTIYGDVHKKTWTQYFRTAPNQTFQNPVKQNLYHISALKKMYPSIPIYSVVVFTNDGCDLRVENGDPSVIVCRLSELIGKIRHLYMGRRPVYEMEQIDGVFQQLREYAPEGKSAVQIDGEVIPLYQYIEALACDFNEGLAQCRELIRKAVKRMSVTCAVYAILAFLICAAVSRHCADKIAAAEETLATFAQKFEHVEEFNKGVLVFSDELVSVSDVVLAESKDVQNAVNFSCLLTACGEKYGVVVREDTMINVILHDGTVKEYDLWNDSYPYIANVRIGGLLQPTGKIAMHEFYDISVSDISYIKLTNLGIWSMTAYSSDDIAEGYEIELYDSSNTIPK